MSLGGDIMSHKDNKKIPQNRIAELRKKAGLSQAKLAKEIKVSNQLISKYESGERNPKIENWQKLANYFNVSISYLQGISENKEPIFAGIENLDLEADLNKFNKLLSQKGKDNKLAKLLKSVNALPIEQGVSVASTFETFVTCLIYLMNNNNNSTGIISELANFLGIIPVVSMMERNTCETNEKIEKIIKNATLQIANINSNNSINNKSNS